MQLTESEGFPSAPFCDSTYHRFDACAWRDRQRRDAYKIAPLFNVSVSYIYKILARRRTTGETSARPQRHGPLPKLASYSDLLRDRVAAVPDTTIDELRLWFLSEHKIKVGNTCVWKQLGRLGLTLKKTRRAAEQDRPDVAQARAEWRRNQPSLRHDRLIVKTRGDDQELRSLS